MIQNRVSFQLTPEQTQTIYDAINTIRQTLSELITLTNEEKLGMVKLGDGNLPFALKAVDYMSQNPTNVPPFIEVSEVQRDAKTHDDLEGIEREMLALIKMITDTRFTAGSEWLQASLIYYKFMGHAASIGVPGAKQIHDDLKKRFKSNGAKSTDNGNKPDDEAKE